MFVDRCVVRWLKLSPMAFLLCALGMLAGCGDANPVSVKNGKGGAASSNNSSTTGDGTAADSGARTTSNAGSSNAGTSNTGNAGSGGAGAGTAVAGSASEAEAIITKMADAYRAANSYEDNAVFREVINDGGPEPLAYETPLYVTFSAPNKIRAQIGGSMIVSDGTKIYGSYYDVPGYVAVRDAPNPLTPEAVFFDPRLGKDQLPALQVGLLLNDGMADTLIGEATDRPELLEPQDLDGGLCHRVRFLRRLKGSDGQTIETSEIYWIDQQDYLLRRIEVPSAPGEERSIEFVGAKVGAEIPDVAFQIDPTGVKFVKRFVGPAFASSLGQKPEDFEFVSPAGNKITPETLAGKVVVLDFWVEHPTCLANLPRLQQLQEKYAGNDKVQVLSVNIDQTATHERIAEVLKDNNVELPVAKEAVDGQAGGVFGFNNFPYVFILGPEGVVQYCEMGYGTIPGDDPVARLSEKIDAVLAGEDVAQQMIAEFESAMNSESTGISGSATGSSTVPAAPATDPQTIKLEKLWTANVVQAGNILVVPGDNGARIFVNEGYQGLAELSTSGEVVARPELSLGENQVATFMRTATDRAGKRFFALAAVGQQQSRVYDEDWNLVLEYPPTGTENPGIADVQLVDLDGSGHPLLAVGYFDVVGIQGVDFSGERAWWNRSIGNVTSIATSSSLEGQPLLLCTNSQPTGALASILPDGTRGDDVKVADKLLRLIAGADLNGDGYNEYCGFAFSSEGSDVAVGFNADGAELWTHPMPAGNHLTLNQLGWGQVVGDSAHWILGGADGSLHFVTYGGLVLDSFSAGELINGFAAVQIDGSPALLLSTSEGVTAWKITAK